MRRGAVRSIALLAGAAALLGAGRASASQTLGDLNITNVTLAVNAKGEALLTYNRQNGQLKHVLVWGADALIAFAGIVLLWRLVRE